MDHRKLAKEQLALLMADRFYRRYFNTIKIVVNCREYINCRNWTIMSAVDDYNYPDAYMCDECQKEYFLYAYK